MAKLSVVIIFSFVWAVVVAEPPSSCDKLECPKYDVIYSGDEFEIRRYISPVWVSTSPIKGISFNETSRAGFLQLLKYIDGQNDQKKRIKMTAPVLTDVLPSDGPFCGSMFNVSFYIPKKDQPNPPKAEGVHVEKWGETYAAVRRFVGFATDDGIGKEAATLKDSLKGTKWDEDVKKGMKPGYYVAQYNDPRELRDRTNEIWFTFAKPK